MKRGGSFEVWKYGEMRALGSRQAQGGIPADSYTMYAGMEGQSDDEIRALFAHASVSFTDNVATCINKKPGCKRLDVYCKIYACRCFQGPPRWWRSKRCNQPFGLDRVKSVRL